VRSDDMFAVEQQWHELAAEVAEWAVQHPQGTLPQAVEDLGITALLKPSTRPDSDTGYLIWQHLLAGHPAKADPPGVSMSPAARIPPSPRADGPGRGTWPLLVLAALLDDAGTPATGGRTECPLRRNHDHGWRSSGNGIC
jgi:hypothetical protein